MRKRLYKLREVTTFLDSRKKVDLFESRSFELSLAYLVDIFEAFNAANLQLQKKHQYNQAL